MSPTPVLWNCRNLAANATSYNVTDVFTRPKRSQESAEQSTFADLNGFQLSADLAVEKELLIDLKEVLRPAWTDQ